MADVFIANLPSDENTAQQIKTALRQIGLKATIPTFSPGDRWTDPLAIPKTVKCVLVLWSRWTAKSRLSKAISFKAIKAWSSDRLVLAKVDDAALPVGLRDLSTISIRGSSIAPPGEEPEPISDTKELVDRVRSVVEQKATRVMPRSSLDLDAAHPHDPARRISAAQEPAAAVDGKHVFVSYSRQDGRTVDSLVQQIEKIGVSVWIDRELSGPQRYAKQIVAAIRDSRLVALMCSQYAFSSDHVIREIYVAADCKKPFVAFQLDPTEFPDEFLYFLSGFPRVQLDTMDPQRLYSEIGRLLSSNGRRRRPRNAR